MTNDLGLDRAPVKILTFIFSPLYVRPPNPLSSIAKTGIVSPKILVSHNIPLLQIGIWFILVLELDIIAYLHLLVFYHI